MSYGNPVVLEQTDKFAVWSYGNGAAYELTAKDKPGYSTAFLQDDDALSWRDEYDAMKEAHANENSVWFGQTWNSCLAELINPYLSEN